MNPYASEPVATEKSAADLFGGFQMPVETAKQERGELYRQFMQRLNPSRIQAGFKGLSEARMGKILQGIPTHDLYYLLSICKQAKSFSKTFWWELNPKNHADK